MALPSFKAAMIGPISSPIAIPADEPGGEPYAFSTALILTQNVYFPLTAQITKLKFLEICGAIYDSANQGHHISP